MMMAASAWVLPYWVWVDSRHLVLASAWRGYCGVGVGSLYLSVSPLYLPVSPHYLSVSFLFIFPSSFSFSVRFIAEFFFLTWVMGSCSWAGRLGLEFKIFGKGVELKTKGGPKLKTKLIFFFRKF